MRLLTWFAPGYIYTYYLDIYAPGYIYKYYLDI